MDDWTHPYPDFDPPEPHPPLLDQGGREIEARRARAQRAEAAHLCELEQAEGQGADPHALTDVPRPWAAPPGAALTF